MSLSDGIAWEKEYGWTYKDHKMFKANCIVTETKLICIQAKTEEEFRHRMKELGHIVVGLVFETSRSKETVVRN